MKASAVAADQMQHHQEPLRWVQTQCDELSCMLGSVPLVKVSRSGRVRAVGAVGADLIEARVAVARALSGVGIAAGSDVSAAAALWTPERWPVRPVAAVRQSRALAITPPPAAAAAAAATAATAATCSSQSASSSSSSSSPPRSPRSDSSSYNIYSSGSASCSGSGRSVDGDLGHGGKCIMCVSANAELDGCGHASFCGPCHYRWAHALVQKGAEAPCCPVCRAPFKDSCDGEGCGRVWAVELSCGHRECIVCCVRACWRAGMCEGTLIRAGMRECAMGCARPLRTLRNRHGK